MKIVKFKAENVKRLKVVEITPKGNIVQITGPNASGKSSVLDAIYMALAGASVIPTKPVREGEETAKVTLDLGECVVTRKFTKDGKTTLTVEALSGSRFPSPQKMLDSLVAGLSFDPLAFTRMGAKEQLETLKKLVKLDVDADALDGLNARDYETRTELNREIKKEEGQLAGIKIPETSKEDLELDEEKLLNEMNDAAQINNNIQVVMQNHAIARRGYEAGLEELRKAKEAIVLLEKRVQADKADLDHAANAVAALREPIDLVGVRERLNRARAVTVSKRLLEQRATLVSGIKWKVDQVAELTQQMAARLKQKEEAIARAKMPVKQLSFGEGEVYYKGVPFVQASSAEQLLISTAIAMNANPQLRVLRIQDGSLLDASSLEMIARMAERGDYQIWIETVASTDPMAIHMSDGEVVPAAEPAKVGL